MNSVKSKSLLATLLLFGLSALPMTVLAQSTEKDGVPRYVEANLVPEFDAITAGGSVTLAITQKHVSGWHTYWKNPGDSGETTSIEWLSLPEGFSQSEILYPAPEKMATGPLMNFGFGGDVTLLTTLTAPKNLKASSSHFVARLIWLACSDICVPEMKEIAFDLRTVGAESEALAAAPDLFKAARTAIPEEKAWQGSLEETEQSLHLTFMIDEEDKALLAGAADFFFVPEDWGVMQNAAPQDVKFENNKIIMTLQRDSRPLSDLQTLQGILTFTNAKGEHQGVSLSLPITASKAAAAPLPENSTAPTAPKNATSWISAVFLALMGGIVLNLMPCVFPVLSMKALSLIKMSEKEQRHANLHGIFYTLGVMVCFGMIAGTLITLQMAGEQIGWGFQLQNPVVVLLLSYLLFAMALNLSGFFEMKGHFFSNIGHKLAARHGYSGTFFTGMLATIVATPCTGPFMASAIGFALTQPAAISLSVFMALGFGLSLPYLLLCFIPKLRKSLPKPGKWMETFKQFMSFPLFASVAWLIWVYAQQVNGEYGTLLGLTGLVLIAFSVWVSRHEPHRQPMKSAIHAVSIGSFVLALVIAGLSHSTPQSQQSESAAEKDIPSITFTKETLDKLIQGDDPILVDMTASWCITCQVNEKIALETDATQSLFKERNVQYVVGDWTNRNPEITEFLASYGRNGVPLYVYYGPRNMLTNERPEAVILPQLLTEGLIAETINGTPE